MNPNNVELLKTSDFTLVFCFWSDITPPLTILSQEEFDICSRFKSEKRKNEYLAGRYVAKLALASESDTDFEFAKNFSILNDDKGSPYIKNSDFNLTITHSNKIAVALVSKFVYGIDIEKINIKRLSALKRMSPTQDNPKILTTFWTLKEALSKALKTGIIEPFNKYEIENFQNCGSYFRCTFQNFSDYEGLSFYISEMSFSIVSLQNLHNNCDKLIKFFNKIDL